MSKDDFSKELNALTKVLEALSQLDDQQRIFVLDTVNARLNLSRTPAKVGNVEPSSYAENNGHSGKLGQTIPSAKEFLNQKKPANGVEQLICLAYYLSKYRDITAFKTIDLTKLNSEAAGHKISNASVFARNAVTQNGYLVTAGGGKKQMTPRGDAVVEALPDREKVKRALEENWFKGRKKKKQAGKSRKKPAQ